MSAKGGMMDGKAIPVRINGATFYLIARRRNSKYVVYLYMKRAGGKVKYVGKLFEADTLKEVDEVLGKIITEYAIYASLKRMVEEVGAATKSDFEFGGIGFIPSDVVKKLKPEAQSKLLADLIALSHIRYVGGKEGYTTFLYKMVSALAESRVLLDLLKLMKSVLRGEKSNINIPKDVNKAVELITAISSLEDVLIRMEQILPQLTAEVGYCFRYKQGNVEEPCIGELALLPANDETLDELVKMSKEYGDYSLDEIVEQERETF